jgi:hypothetical protein
MDGVVCSERGVVEVGRGGVDKKMRREVEWKRIMAVTLPSSLSFDVDCLGRASYSCDVLWKCG